MKFMFTFDWVPNSEMRAEGIRRFMSGEGTPPEGVQLIGRWTRADLSGGYGLVETDDLEKLAQFGLAWNDLMELNLTPVLEDASLASVFQRVFSK